MPTSARRLTRVLLYLLSLLAIGGSVLYTVSSATDSTAEPAYRFDAFGDSITWGEPISFRVDEQGIARYTTKRYQGWPELLGDLLPTENGGDDVVTNKGVPGVKVNKIRQGGVWASIKGLVRSRDALVLIGTNDSNPAVQTPSGLGCQGAACDGTYAGNLRRLIDELISNGSDKVFVGVLPPIWGDLTYQVYQDPLGPDAERNKLVAEYNNVITDELTRLPGVSLGPDFYSCFLTPTSNRFSLFRNSLHPNTLGYVVMAALWRDAIENGGAEAPMDPCPSPVYILDSLDPYKHGHKQNLLTVGDTYYTDEEHALLAVPAELADGIWVLQANADRDSDDAGFLEFDVGDSPVTVFIAYDPHGEPPVSATHEFSVTKLSSDLKVSDPAVGAFELVAANDVTGFVRIGGNKSAGGPNQQQAYVVIVVP